MAFTKYSVTKNGQRAAELRKRAGTYLKQLREDAKMTQADLAKKLGLEYYTFISQVETGLTRLPPEHYPEAAKAFGMKTEELAKNLLRYYDPFTYAALFGAQK